MFNKYFLRKLILIHSYIETDRGEIKLHDPVLTMVTSPSLVHTDVLCANFVGGFTIIASSSEMSTTCHQYAIPFLCYFTFPLCDMSSDEPRPRQVCRDECEELENHICEKEYKLGMNHPDIGTDFLLIEMNTQRSDYLLFISMGENLSSVLLTCFTCISILVAFYILKAK